MTPTRKAKTAFTAALAMAVLSMASCGGADEPGTTTTNLAPMGGSGSGQGNQNASNGQTTAIPSGKPVQVYWGAQIGDQLTGAQAPWDMGAVTAFEQIAGKSPSIVAFGLPFEDCLSGTCQFQDFYPDLFQGIRDYGAIPFFSWASQQTPASTDQPDFQLRDVTAGKYDEYIRRWAEGARDWGHPFFLRFNWEMNGFWFPWGVRTNGNRTEDYVPAWRHVHDIFSEVGADNVSWVWCPNVDQHQPARDLSPLYPGDDYVDWTCLDGFNWGVRRGSPGWRSFSQIFAASYRRLLQLAPDKPIILGETASSDRGGDKAAWIRDMLARLPREFPAIGGFVWLEFEDRGAHWPIELSKPVTAEFRRGIAKPWFLANDYGSLEGGPIPPPPSSG